MTKNIILFVCASQCQGVESAVLISKLLEMRDVDTSGLMSFSRGI